jgi:hypothetical protein
MATTTPCASPCDRLMSDERVRAVSGWRLVAGVLGASFGLVVSGAVADVGTPLGLAVLVTTRAQ